MVPPSGDEKRWIWRSEYFRAFANADIKLIKTCSILLILILLIYTVLLSASVSGKKWDRGAVDHCRFYYEK